MRNSRCRRSLVSGSRHSSQRDPWPALGLFESHPGAQRPASRGRSLVLARGGPGPRHRDTAKAPAGTRVAQEGTQPRRGTQGRAGERGEPGAEPRVSRHHPDVPMCLAWCWIGDDQCKKREGMGAKSGAAGRSRGLPGSSQTADTLLDDAPTLGDSAGTPLWAPRVPSRRLPPRSVWPPLL